MNNILLEKIRVEISKLNNNDELKIQFNNIYASKKLSHYKPVIDVYFLLPRKLAIRFHEIWFRCAKDNNNQQLTLL